MSEPDIITSSPRASFTVKRRLLLAAALAGVMFLGAGWLIFRPREAVAPVSNPIARAVITGNPEVIDLSASAKLVTDAIGDNRPPLLKATQERDAALVERLLASGADVEASDATGLTPLMVAAQKGDLDLLRRFLDGSAKVATRDANGFSAIHYAINARRAEAVALLLASGSSIDIAATDGVDLLEVACATGDPKIIGAVLTPLPANLPWAPRARAALTAAISSGNRQLTSLLLTRHPAPPTVEGGTIPLLAQSIVTDDRTVFEGLLAAGTDVNVVLPTPVEKSFVSLIKSEDLRSYVRGDVGITPLMIAAGLGKNEYVRALLAAGANRNLQTTRYKMLALYFAAHARKLKSVQMLLGRGPDPEQLRVEISLAKQRASVIKDGVAILQTAVSTGRKGFDTPAGEYVITDKNRSHRSSVYHVEMPFFMRLNCLDFGLHAGAVPNYPASHGCIRLPAEIAQKLFSEIPVGTLVMIN